MHSKFLKAAESAAFFIYGQNKRCQFVINNLIGELRWQLHHY
jgi:hypothetical protein